MNILKALLTIVRRRLLVLFIVSVLAVGSQVAFAHYVYEEEYTYWSTTVPCVKTRSETSHGGGYGYAKGNVTSERVKPGDPPKPCNEKFLRPQNHIKIAIQVHHRPSGGSWQVCWSSAYQYNQSVTAKMQKTKTFNSSTWCGPGTYGTWALTYVKNNSWYGGDVWSGTHTLD